MLKKVLVTVLMLAVVLSLAACGGDGGKDKESKKNNDVLKIMDSEWYGIDTFQLDSTSGYQSLTAEAPFQWDPEKGKIVDNVLTDWKVGDDGKTVTFNVPEGLQFYDGSPVEPKDVIASIKHGLELSPYNDMYNNIESLDENGRQVTMHLSEYSSPMEYSFCAGFVVIIPAKELESMDKDALVWGCHPYGRFTLEKDGYISGSEVKLVRNDNFKCFNPLSKNKGPSKFKKVDIKFNVEAFTQTEELKNGGTDIIRNISSDQKKDLEDADNVKIVEESYPETCYIELNQNQGIFQDINVRKALALCIDRESFVKLMDNSIKPSYSLVIPSMQNFNKDAYKWYKKNMSNNQKEAKKLLEESGWKMNNDGIMEKDGKKLQFTFYAWTGGSTTVAEALVDQVKKVGFDMKIESQDWNYVNEKIAAGNYEAGFRSVSWAEPILVFNIAYYDKTGFENEEAYKEEVKNIAREINGEKRTKMVGDLQMSMYKNCHFIPLYITKGYGAYNKDLKGIKVLKDGTSLFSDYTFE